MDSDLFDEWTTTEGEVCGSCAALTRASKRHKDSDHPHAWRFVVGLRQGWERRKERAVTERQSADDLRDVAN